MIRLKKPAGLVFRPRLCGFLIDMAQRRMFSPDIVSSEEFLSMPVSSRELYFQLGMNADDDGFVQPRLIMKLTGATDDDLKVLIVKRFVLTFQSGVIVIKHWLIHNMIRLDRYKPTRFQEEKKELSIKENKAYTDRKLLGCQNGNQPATQVRLGKVRLGKDISIAAPEVAAVSEEKFDLPAYLEEMDNDKRRHIQIIGYFIEKKGLKFDNKKEIQAAINRHCRDAKELVGFSALKVDKAMEQCQKKYSDVGWTLRTVLKELTK